MKKKLFLVVVLTGSILVFSGCATLFGGGSKQTINIHANKSMKVIVSHTDGSSLQYVTLPDTISVERGYQNLIIKSENKEFNTKVVKTSINPWFFANIIGISIAPIFSTTDAVSGAMWEYDEVVTVHGEE